MVPTELLRKKEGSVGDINLLLASMLEKAGFKVSMVLLSTRGNGGLTEKLTSLGQFDYVICEVTLPDGQHLLVDATQRYLPYDMIPPDCLTHKGFLVTKGQFGWVAIEAPQAEKISVEANFTVSETGGLKGTVRTLKDGYKAYNARVSYFDEGEKDYKNHFIGSNIWTVEKSEILNMENLDKPVVENYTLSTEGYATVANDLIYLNPHIFLREESNPFVSATRTYPVDLKVRTDNTVMFNITIPEGYKVEEMPENNVLTLPGNAAKCTFSFTQTDNKITAMSKLQFNKTLFEPFEYAELKEFYNRLVDKKAETIVLKKQ